MSILNSSFRAGKNPLSSGISFYTRIVETSTNDASVLWWSKEDIEIGAVPLCKASGEPALGDCIQLTDGGLYKREFLKCSICEGGLGKGMSHVAKGVVCVKCSDNIEADMLQACGSVSEGNNIAALKSVHKLMTQGLTQDPDDAQKATIHDDNAAPASQAIAKKILSDLLDIDASMSTDTWQDSVYGALSKMVPFAEPPQFEDEEATDAGPTDFTSSGGEYGAEDWSDGGGLPVADTWDDSFGPTLYPHFPPTSTKTPNKQAHLTYDILAAIAGDDNPLMQVGLAGSPLSRGPAVRLGTPAATEPSFDLSSSHVVASGMLQATCEASWWKDPAEKDDEEEKEKDDEWHGTNEQADAQAKFPAEPKERVKQTMFSLKEIRKFVPDYSAPIAYDQLAPQTDHPYFSVTRDFQRLLLTSEIGDDMPLLQGGLVLPPPKTLDIEGLEPPDYISPEAVDPLNFFKS